MTSSYFDIRPRNKLLKATRGTVEHEQSGRNLMEIPWAYC